jgi:AcrR family transcriptional regulator
VIDQSSILSASMEAGKTTRSDTRAQILTIARRLFVGHGYAGTSIADIARELGTTTAALYYHFPSKADILAELLAGPLQAFSHIAERAAGLPSGELLTEVVDLTLEWGDLIGPCRPRAGRPPALGAARGADCGGARGSKTEPGGEDPRVGRVHRRARGNAGEPPRPGRSGGTGGPR